LAPLGRCDCRLSRAASVSTARRPPRCTLFPYTTLFRSHRALQNVVGGAERLHHGGVAAEHGDQLFIRDGDQRVAVLAQLLDALEDRKSTRLNSSHVKISYAVFCLKQKIGGHHGVVWVDP